MQGRRLLFQVLISLVCIFWVTHLYADLNPSLEGKLSLQWENYRNARRLLLNRISDPALPIDQKRISRQEWESELTSGGQLQWSSEELANLRQNQAHQIEKARQYAISHSVISFHQWRQLPQKVLLPKATQFCSVLPKGGMLHVHPTGTVNRATAQFLLENLNPKLPIRSQIQSVENSDLGFLLYPNELQRLKAMEADTPYLDLNDQNRHSYLEFLFLPPGAHPFERFDSAFLFIRPVVKPWQALEIVFLDFAKRAVDLGVSYVEFTFGVDSSEIPSLVRILEKVQRETGLITRVNRAFHRTLSWAALRRDVEDLFKMPDQDYVVGIDLLGNEIQAPALESGQEIYGNVLLADQHGGGQFHRTMHAGELGDVRNPRDAMVLGAERLGHGVRLIEDPVAMEYAARHQIAVEINLTSNLRLQGVDRLENHPYLNYLRLGIPVSLSTDDEGVFETNIHQECVKAVMGTDLTYFELKQMIWNSIRTSFASSSLKESLMDQLSAQFEKFEATLNLTKKIAN